MDWSTDVYFKFNGEIVLLYHGIGSAFQIPRIGEKFVFEPTPYVNQIEEFLLSTKSFVVDSVEHKVKENSVDVTVYLIL